MLRCVLVLAAAVGLFSLAAVAQTQPDKKTTGKGKDDLKTKGKDDLKAKGKDDDGKTKEMPKAKLPLDKTKLPKDAIIVVVDNLLDAMGIFPKMAVLDYDEYVKMLETINSLKRQLKTEKKTPFSCKLFGRLEDDFLICRAEFLFSTEQPRTVVSLGLKDGHLLGLGELDGRPPILDVGADGFSVRVDKEGDHQLVLNFRTPAKIATSGGIERQVKLGLADSAVTIVSLELPGSVKELRCNDTLEKTKVPGRWVIGLERAKLLKLEWKEPAPLSGNAAPKADVQTAVRVLDKDVNIFAKFFLQDARLQTKEWRLLVPAQAKVELETPPAGVAYELIPPIGNIPYYTLKTPEATAERWQVVVSASVPRPNPGVRLPIGPLHVLGAQQAGTITVTMPANYSFGQRLVFTRTDALRQLKNTETEAVFEYVVDKNPKGNTGKAPLDIEWRFEKNQAKTEVRHAFKLRAASQAWEIEATTRIKVTALFATVNSVDIKLPQPYPQGTALLGSMMPGAGFPAGLPWVGMWKAFGMSWAYASPDDFTIADEAGNPVSTARLDATGRTRVSLERPAKEITLVLRSSYRVPLQSHHLRLETPRPLNTQDRGAKVSIQADERVELLHGPAGAQEVVPDRDHFEQSFDQAPGVIDITWRPFQREIVAKATLDIDVHEHSAQVQQSLRFARERSATGSDVKNPLIELLVPAGIEKLTAVSGGKLTFDHARHKAWLRPSAEAGDIDVVLTYDLAVKDKTLRVTPIWPASASQKDVKVRAWTPAGVQARLNAETIQRGVWKERSIEVVPEKKHFPALVLVAFGADLPLTIDVRESAVSSLAAFIADRALIEVRTAEDGGQQVRARYFIRKLNAATVDIELPLALPRFRDRPTFLLGKDALQQWEVVDASEKVVRLTLHPDQVKLPAVLEISYAVPADALERSSFWRTTLHAPVFRSEVMISQMRWELLAQSSMIVASLDRNVRADVQWGLQGLLLTPEPSVTSGELDAWLLGKEAPAPTGAVTFAVWHVSSFPETVYHLPKQWWLLGCSGLILIVGLGTYLTPLRRWVFWTLVSVFVVGVSVFAIAFPAGWAPVLFGAQPGIALLIVFIGIHLLVQEQYRRQLVFLPGFIRAKPSTMVRPSSAKLPREASTVDAPTGGPPSPSTKPSSA